jgi:hypothetical protein
MSKIGSKKKRSREEMEEVKDVEQNLYNNKLEFLKQHKRLRDANDALNEEV